MRLWPLSRRRLVGSNSVNADQQEERCAFIQKGKEKFNYTRKRRDGSPSASIRPTARKNMIFANGKSNAIHSAFLSTLFSSFSMGQFRNTVFLNS